MVNVTDLAGASTAHAVSPEHLLAQLGRLVRRELRETDLIARLSDNSLIALLPESG